MVDTTHTSLAHNITLLKKRDGLTWQQVGDIVGVSAQAAIKWGKGGDIADDNLRALANHWGLEPGELKFKTLTLNYDALLEAAMRGGDEGHPRPGELPVISSVKAGGWSEAFDPYAPGAASEWLYFEQKFSPQAFVLKVKGDSMENPGRTPSFPDGSYIVVEPALRGSIRSGDFVVVRHPDWDEATFKQYFRDAGIALLRPLNPRHPVQPMPYDAVICGKVVRRKVPDEEFE